jgi:2-polyprenyl-3-methyl-5-hydroxy-6-metoxy-1,4-benzoquinol methylase
MEATERLRPADLRRYWERLSDQMLKVDPQGLSVTCFAGMPPWFNRFLDRYQRRALKNLVQDIDLRGLRVLDVGTGVGRWAEWYLQRGARQVVGIDVEGKRLLTARERHNEVGVVFERMSVDCLAFSGSSFDLVNSITVLQHVNRPMKEHALAEMSRVLRPGGHAVLFELTDLKDDAPHVFPEERAAWLQMARRHRLYPLRTVGEQYIPLLRAARGTLRFLARGESRGRIDAIKEHAMARPTLDASMLFLRMLVMMSYPIEEIAQRCAPARGAKITGFLLRKHEGAR